MSVLTVRPTAIVETEMNEIIDKTNEALKARGSRESDAIVAKCTSDLAPLAKEYRLGRENEYYADMAKISIGKDENAMVNIIKAASFNTKVLATTKDEISGKVIEVALTDKAVRIDLAAFDRVYAKTAPGKTTAAHDQMWTYAISKLNQLFCLDRAEALGASKAIINKTYFLREKARDIELGKTPTSNTQLLNAVQEVVDMLVYVENEKTKHNTYKATSHDVAYLKAVYTRISSKEELNVTVMNDRRFNDAIVRMMKKIITGGKYGVDGYKTKKK